MLGAAGIDTTGVLRDASFSTTVKTRIIARHQQITRVDRERMRRSTPPRPNSSSQQIERAIDDVDAVIVADYGKGFLTQPLADRIGRKARAHGENPGRRSTSPHLARLAGCDRHQTQPPGSVSGSWRSARRAGRAAARGPAPLLEAGRRLQRLWRPGSLLITLGAQGMLLLEERRAAVHTPTRAKDVFDVSGAGDTAIAVLDAGAGGRGHAQPKPPNWPTAPAASWSANWEPPPSPPPNCRPPAPTHERRRAVFFDRDGTLMEEVHYCGDPAR